MDSKEKDWKLYKKNIAVWQERYIWIKFLKNIKKLLIEKK